MKLKIEKSQSTLEYVIMLTALIAFVLWAAGALFQPALQTGLSDTQRAVERAADNIN